MSYIVKLQVKVTSMRAIGKLLAHRNYLAISALGGERTDIRGSRGKYDIAKMLEAHESFALRNVNTGHFAHFNRGSDGVDLAIDSDYLLRVNMKDYGVDRLHPVHFLIGRSSREVREVSDFYVQAQTMDQLEEQNIFYSVAPDYLNEQGIWMPGNIRVSLDEQQLNLVGVSA